MTTTSGENQPLESGIDLRIGDIAAIQDVRILRLRLEVGREHVRIGAVGGAGYWFGLRPLAVPQVADAEGRRYAVGPKVCLLYTSPSPRD